jgi:hypothetical protein
MDMKRFVFAILMIFSLLCALTGCSLPIGTLEPDNNDEVEALWLIPRRQLYQLDEKFERDKDFQLFVVDQGRVVEILPAFAESNGVKVELSGQIGMSNEFHIPLYGKNDTISAFHIVGRYLVNVAYKGKSSYYSIEVFPPTNGTGLGGDDGIGIIWLD